VSIPERLVRAELQRLNHPPEPGDRPSGVGIVRFVARCPLGSDEVLANAKSLLKMIDEASLERWPTEEEWKIKLPDWLTSKCSPPICDEAAEKWLAWWRSLPAEEKQRAEAEQGWTLDNWLYSMEPRNRQWFWWDAKSLSDLDHLVVAVEVEAWPFPWGSLQWLIKSAGASTLDPEE
jgi:hypothetical protein